MGTKEEEIDRGVESRGTEFFISATEFLNHEVFFIFFHMISSCQQTSPEVIIPPWSSAKFAEDFVHTFLLCTPKCSTNL
jgi:hypothetical protein